MKKIAIVMSLFAAVALASCSGKTDSGKEELESTDQTEQTDQIEQDATPAAEPSVEDAVVELEADDYIRPADMTNPLVIDFNATWCGPCQKFGPVFHKVAAEYQAKANFASADVDVCKNLADEYKISSIPAIVIIYPSSTGKAPVSSVGNMDETEFKEFLNKNL